MPAGGEGIGAGIGGRIGDGLRRCRNACAAALSRSRWADRSGRRRVVLAAALLGLVLVIAFSVAVFAPDPAADAGPGHGASVAAGVPLPPVSAPMADDGVAGDMADNAAENGMADAVAKAKADGEGGLRVPATTAEAFARIAPVSRVKPLPEDADPSLLETLDGNLAVPRPGADGRVPWQAYAGPFDRTDDRPRVVIVVSGLGLSDAATDAAIERLPGAVSLAFVPEARDLAAHLRAARRYGHETLAMLALELADFPFEDPGPGTLTADADEGQNLLRLNRVLAAAPGSVGVLAVGGTRFARAEAAVRQVLRALGARGVLLADASGGGAALLAGEAARLDLPRVVVDSVIDETLDAAAIDARLAGLEEQARRNHVAVGLIQPRPVSLQRTRAWLDTLAEKRLVLAPLSAVVGAQIRTNSIGAGR